ncbi:Retinal dehydrogenase 2 [Strongyloides ratti]|uniref:Retinal dehydrogenase 2 n=1 Tax=Strongyloides ratti TaxID=34506 RepID=A0A090MNI9_STRRB|nr:Retinal dehydrogenase 2 [Strongyloides ratti]CEF59631.1 Retinal dehydrogenase 2 [Strongyloides ratti]
MVCQGASEGLEVYKKMGIPPPVCNIKPTYTKLFINNEFVDGKNKKTFDTINPSTNEVICSVAEAEAEDVDLAVSAAREAFKLGSEWRRMDASKRGVLLNKLADILEREKSTLASLESLDNGKSYKVALTVDIPFSVSILRYYAGWADKNCGQVVPVDGDFFTYTRHEPVGVCGAVIPWNFPLLMAIFKIAPALATGNTVVLKASEETPLTALHLASLVKEAGFPAGVVNVIPGFGHKAGEALAKHPNVDKIAFTGSTAVGKLIMENAAKSNLKRVTLELGGKSPNIIFDDVDLDEAVVQAVDGIMFNMGQCCCAGSRTFVHAKIYDQFIAKAKAYVEAKKIGCPFDPTVDQGPQISTKQMNTIMSYIESGKEEGARLITGGSRFGEKGCFIQPTIFADVKNGMKIAKEEIFGPVMCIFKFEDEKNLVDIANDTIYGLAAGVMTNDVSKALYVANSIRAGSVWVNCYNVTSAAAPFGGYKMSGIGRELGEYGLQAYTEVKTVTIKVSQKNS